MAPRNCCLCSNKSRFTSYHSFPKDIEGINLWKKVCNYEDYDDVSRLAICSLHFTPDDYMNPNAKMYGGRMKLKAGSAPSIQVPNKVTTERGMHTAPTVTSKLTFESNIVDVYTLSVVKKEILPDGETSNSNSGEEIITGSVSPGFVDTSKISDQAVDVPEQEDPLYLNRIPPLDSDTVRKQFDLAMDKLEKEKDEQHFLYKKKLQLQPVDVLEQEDPLSLNGIPPQDSDAVRKQFDLAMEKLEKEKDEQNSLCQRKLQLLNEMQSLQKTINKLKQDNSKKDHIRATSAARMRRWREAKQRNETPEEAAFRRLHQTEERRKHRYFRQVNETPEQAAERREQQAEQMRRHRYFRQVQETTEQAAARRALQAEERRRHRLLRQVHETPEQAAERRARQAEERKRHRASSSLRNS